METATEIKTVAGEKTQFDSKGKIVELAWKMKRDGASDTTIENYTKFLNMLLEKGANLLDPESVKQTIASQEHWGTRTKILASASYHKYAKINSIQWEPPRYRTFKKVPFIPLESEIDALIAHCGRKTSTALQLLKETGMRVGEAVRLEWIDIDCEHNMITLNNPEKNGTARVFKVSNRLIAMINSLPKKEKRILGDKCYSRSLRSTFNVQRKRASQKLQNPRLLQIHFHTLRHWKATMEYAKTKDILHVMKILGHKQIENTLIYTQLVTFESNEYHSATAKTVDEAKGLIEAGFEYVCTSSDIMLFRRRK